MHACIACRACGPSCPAKPVLLCLNLAAHVSAWLQAVGHAQRCVCIWPAAGVLCRDAGHVYADHFTHWSLTASQRPSAQLVIALFVPTSSFLAMLHPGVLHPHGAQLLAALAGGAQGWQHGCQHGCSHGRGQPVCMSVGGRAPKGAVSYACTLAQRCPLLSRLPQPARPNPPIPFICWPAAQAPDELNVLRLCGHVQWQALPAHQRALRGLPHPGGLWASAGFVCMYGYGTCDMSGMCIEGARGAHVCRSSSWPSARQPLTPFPRSRAPKVHCTYTAPAHLPCQAPPPLPPLQRHRRPPPTCAPAAPAARCRRSR